MFSKYSPLDLKKQTCENVADIAFKGLLAQINPSNNKTMKYLKNDAFSHTFCEYYY